MSDLWPVFEKIAEYVGELTAAAKHDWKTANPSDVGMNGVPIVGWRDAYHEGCRDMANGVFTRVPEEIRERFQNKVVERYNATLAELAVEHTNGEQGGAL